MKTNKNCMKLLPHWNMEFERIWSNLNLCSWAMVTHIWLYNKVSFFFFSFHVIAVYCCWCREELREILYLGLPTYKGFRWRVRWKGYIGKIWGRVISKIYSWVLGLVVQVYTQEAEASGIQGYPQLQSQFNDTLGYSRWPCLKRRTKIRTAWKFTKSLSFYWK